MIYTVIDVETTGPSNKITEISIFRYDDAVLVDEFTSLVNPETLIPDYITDLTGIDDYMVSKAPKFHEIAENILAITQQAVFIAHNVSFDYNVIRNEFKALGVAFNRKKLCTVRLSRKLIPGHKSYSLGKICQDLGIPIHGRHRAKGDVEATVILFQKLLEQPDAQDVIQVFLKKDAKETKLPKNLKAETYNQLPKAIGVYYFKDKKDTVIYVGHATDIQKQVLKHFNSKAEKELLLTQETVDIDFELSGSETIALLMEDAAIKEYNPKYNQVLKRAPKAYGIFSYQDRNGIIHLAFNTLKAAPSPFHILYSIKTCQQYLEKLCKQFNLCPKYCHLQEGLQECSGYEVQSCKGVCRKTESVALYNIRVKQAIEYSKTNSKNMILKQQGRHENENAFIMIKDSLYCGYGFIDKEEQMMTSEDLEPFLIQQNDNVDVQRILRPTLLSV
ncbi:GIY-YIG nuclease family protein [Tamlana sp. s12]|uniref:exonuclease domain-containing protein n=1 Tax=Tamlana sp. s12 TaxID=1630406 RepID=UPI0008022FD4|nr:exonuclease domain-containing protein [Tamlana sp. s12]OBQ56600.1 DNA polymerase III subunit epsilon [Tamlana sp. s12]QQY81763.1 GIY-YIG nuclease family protein [Tamlana sp. s12]